MKFTLVYDGDLPASGNSPKPEAAKDIREKFHPQLVELWKTHPGLRKLRHDARVPEHPGEYQWSEHVHKDFEDDPPPLSPGIIDLCAPIPEGEWQFTPLVRKSLGLACALNITFLRKEHDGGLVLQGGDLDNRLKTLFDGLRKPSLQEATQHPPLTNPLFCLLESDALVMDFAVKSDRLLLPAGNKKHEVRLIVEVTIKVLNLNLINLSLAGD